MKTKSLKMSVVLLVMTFGFLILSNTSCKKDNEPSTPKKVPYSNMNDDSTTLINLTIPRIEISPLKSTEIKLYLSVVDQNGNPLAEFNQYNFIIKQVCTGTTDTAVVGSITFNTLNEDGNNIAVATTLDYSGSMGDDDIENMEEAVKYFINLKEANDYMEIIKFASYVNVVADFTKDRNELLAAVDKYVDVGGQTAFYDAVNEGLIDSDQFTNQNSGFMPAIIGFTDGGNNYGSTSLDEVVANAQQKQIPVYTLGFGDPETYYMNYLADQTGGRYYYTPDPTELQDLYSLISGQLKNLYVVTWTYDDPGCDEVTIVVYSSYTCKRGTFTSWATKHFFPL